MERLSGCTKDDTSNSRVASVLLLPVTLTDLGCLLYYNLIHCRLTMSPIMMGIVRKRESASTRIVEKRTEKSQQNNALSSRNHVQASRINSSTPSLPRHEYAPLNIESTHISIQLGHYYFLYWKQTHATHLSTLRIITPAVAASGPET